MGSYRSVCQARQAGQHNPICMYGMVSKHKHNSILEVFGNVLGTFGSVWERMIDMYSSYVCMVSMMAQYDDLDESRAAALLPYIDNLVLIDTPRI